MDIITGIYHKRNDFHRCNIYVNQEYQTTISYEMVQVMKLKVGFKLTYMNVRALEILCYRRKSDTWFNKHEQFFEKLKKCLKLTSGYEIERLYFSQFAYRNAYELLFHPEFVIRNTVSRGIIRYIKSAPEIYFNNQLIISRELLKCSLLYCKENISFVTSSGSIYELKITTFNKNQLHGSYKTILGKNQFFNKGVYEPYCLLDEVVLPTTFSVS